jgi:hypothetical protein
MRAAPAGIRILPGIAHQGDFGILAFFQPASRQVVAARRSHDCNSLVVIRHHGVRARPTFILSVRFDISEYRLLVIHAEGMTVAISAFHPKLTLAERLISTQAEIPMLSHARLPG